MTRRRLTEKEIAGRPITRFTSMYLIYEVGTGGTETLVVSEAYNSFSGLVTTIECRPEADRRARTLADRAGSVHTVHYIDTLYDTLVSTIEPEPASSNIISPTSPRTTYKRSSVTKQYAVYSLKRDGTPRARPKFGTRPSPDKMQIEECAHYYTERTGKKHIAKEVTEVR